MLINARELENGSLIESEIIIVGGGVAGITLARYLSQAGHDVAIIESGGEEPDLITQNLYSGSATMHAPGKASRQMDEYLLSSRLRYYGGSGNHWDGLCVPLDPVDFLDREWIPYSGWPFTIEELQPYYNDACDLLEIPGLGENNNLPFAPGEPPMFDDKNSNLLIRPHYFTNYTGLIKNGPYEKLKFETANHPLVKVFLHANAVKVSLDPDGKKVNEVTIRCLNGRQHHARGKAFIIATGGIENARLLMNSTDTYKTGIGNHADFLGRCFQGHPVISDNSQCAVFIKTEAQSKLFNYIKRRLYKKHRTSCSLSTSMEAQLESRSGNFTMLLNNRTTESKNTRAIEGLAKNLSQNDAKGFHFEHYYPLFPIEHTPNRNSRITLLKDHPDDIGVPMVKLDWQNNKLDFDCFDRSLGTLIRLMGMHNLGRLQWSGKPYHQLYHSEDKAALKIDRLEDKYAEHRLNLNYDRSHHMGTTRMSSDPTNGVVNEQCRVHGVANLYVAGSSIFPTSGIANPTLTIVALAFRLGKYLHDHR